MDEYDDNSQYMLVAHRKSPRLNPSVVASDTGRRRKPTPPPPPQPEPWPEASHPPLPTPQITEPSVLLPPLADPQPQPAGPPPILLAPPPAMPQPPPPISVKSNTTQCRRKSPRLNPSALASPVPPQTEAAAPPHEPEPKPRQYRFRIKTSFGLSPSVVANDTGRRTTRSQSNIASASVPLPQQESYSQSQTQLETSRFRTKTIFGLNPSVLCDNDGKKRKRTSERSKQPAAPPHEPEAGDAQSLTRPEAGDDQSSPQPEAPAAQSPMHPEPPAAQSPTRPEAADDRSPPEPEAPAAQSPTHPEAGDAQSPTRPEIADDQSPPQPEAPAAQSPMHPEPPAAQSPTRPEAAEDQSPPEPEAPAAQSLMHPEAGDDQSPRQPEDVSDPQSTSQSQNSVPHTPPQPEHSPDQIFSDQSSTHQAVLDDDGSRRCRMRRPLRFCPEALQACRVDLDDSAAQQSAGKRKRSRNGKKSDVRCGRGLGQPRDPARPDDRPELLVVGDAEFTSSPKCTRVITTIRLLTLANMPGPYRSYNMFPTKARLYILQQFMQRYSWGANEDVGRCLDVFENIAADAYSRELTETRSVCIRKYGKEEELWKDFPPRWCKNVEHWKGLCDIWSKDKWDQQSSTNQNNKTKGGHVVHHVAGSRSMYRHKQAMIHEKGPSVGLKDVFDRTHMVDSLSGKVYVNKKAQEAAKSFMELKGIYREEVKDEVLWEIAVDGEDKRGRLFDFGFQSRASKANRALASMDASPLDPTNSTATSAEDGNKTYTKDEVAELLAEKLAAARSGFANEIAAQEMRHKAEMEEIQKHNEYTRECFARLFRLTGTMPPPYNERSSKGNAGGGENGGGEDPQPSQANV